MLKDEHPSKAPVSLSNAVSISSSGICSSPHFENNRVQLLQWLLPLYSMRKQSVYDSDWNFSYHPEPEESGHVMVTDFALEISLPSY